MSKQLLKMTERSPVNQKQAYANLAKAIFAQAEKDGVKDYFEQTDWGITLRQLIALAEWRDNAHTPFDRYLGV